MSEGKHTALDTALEQAAFPRPRPMPALGAEAFAALLHGAAAGVAAPPPRAGLLERVAHSAAAARAFTTTRHADTAAQALAAGVTLRSLYRAAASGAARAGEPLAVHLVELAPGALWQGPDDRTQREWLVLHGSVRIGAVALKQQDYHVAPAGAVAGALHSAEGVLLYQRQALLSASAPAAPTTHRAAAAHWADYAPGIRRRVMWQHDGQAAMLYHTLPGATVPRHGHRHDEECLMLAGDIFLDDVLLRPLDYQIAPAGTGHDGVYTDTGVLLYTHGDVDLDLRAA